MYKTFLLSFVQISRLVRIGESFRTAFHVETMRGCVRTTTTLINHITNIFEGGFSMKTVIPDAKFLKGFKYDSSRYDPTSTLKTQKMSVVSKVISYSRTLIMNLQIT